MEQIIDFTIGFSENVAWPWPIAVYLFLAGISGGAFAAAALVRIFRKQTQITPLFQAASFIALVTILLGMICLVFDLTKPLDFWKILIFYNPTSVMSVGVMALLVFIPTMFLVTLVSFYEFEPVKRLVDGIPCGAALLSVLRKILPVLTWIGLVFALTVCAYTGFLISALVRFPLINTAVLPALFVVGPRHLDRPAMELSRCRPARFCLPHPIYRDGRHRHLVPVEGTACAKQPAGHLHTRRTR